MNGSQHDDDRLALIDPIVRAGRLALALDERQPDDLRAEALVMPAERLCWTLTQPDGGLDLDTCQALVRAARLGRGRRAAQRRPREEVAAARAATGWLRRRWAGLAAAETAAWLATSDWDAPAPAVTWGGATGDPTPVA